MTEKKEARSESQVTKPPRHSIRHPFADIERWYAEFFPRGWLRPFPALHSAAFAHRLPMVDIIERDHEIVVRAEVPGVRKQDVEISLSDSTLTITGRTEHEEEEKDEDYYCKEMSYGTFTRTLDLPAEIDGAKAEASMKDGVLEIQMPKRESAKRPEVSVEIH